jgi:hypothetical protein
MTPNINLLRSTPKGMELRDHFGLPKRLNMYGVPHPKYKIGA